MSDADETPTPTEAEDHEPVGTLTILFGFLLATVALWIFTYFLLLSRG